MIEMRDRIAVLSEFDHPFGLKYIEELIRLDIKISQIIFIQKRDPCALYRQFKERMGDDFIMTKISDVLNNHPLPCYFVKDINSEESIRLIKSFSPGLIIQAAVGIIKKDLLKIAKIGILNCHPGLFPKYRGCTCVEWAIYNNDPIGCTCHFIGKEIDWGQVVIMEELRINKGDDYNEVRKKSLYQCAKVMSKSVRMIIDKEFQPDKIKLNESERYYFKPISKNKIEAVKNRLNKLEYKHYCD